MNMVIFGKVYDWVNTPLFHGNQPWLACDFCGNLNGGSCFFFVFNHEKEQTIDQQAK